MWGSRPNNVQRYAGVTGRLNLVTILGAYLITGMMLVATWGNWPAFAALAGVQMAVIPFNWWVNVRLLRRESVARVETMRAAVNLALTVVSALIAGWPFPVWFWMVYVALVFDQSSPRIFWATLLSFIVVEVVAGAAYGVPWIYPVCFAAFALFCAQIASARIDIVSHMLARSDEQRAQLEVAHAHIQQAHDHLLREARARAQMEVDLRQAQKLEAVWRLAAGIAHEINTPVQFVNDSIQFVREASADLVRLAERYRQVWASVLEGAPVEQAATLLAEAEEEADLDYLTENVPRAMARSAEGLQRIATIVRAMKEFAHPGHKEKSRVDLNQAIRSTLTVARGEYAHVAHVETDLAELPPVACHVSEVNQVVLNLVINAAHAIEDAIGQSEELGRITVRTRLDGDHVLVAVQDTGVGIPPELHDRIFDPFFTTKQLGRGTGQGLAIARSVVQKHAGSLTFDSTVGVGSTFWVRLPVTPPDAIPAEVSGAAA